jgi:hypothetical protein
MGDQPPESSHSNSVDSGIGNLNNAKDNFHHHPLKFVDNLSDQKHIVLFYEELEAARIVEYHYLMNGLLKGQDGIHIISDDIDISSVEDEMIKSGIDVEDFKKKGLLHIRQVSARNYREGPVKGFDSIVKDIVAELKSPSRFRMIARAIPDVSTEEHITDELEVECAYHSTFHNFGGSLLCSYQVEQIEPKRRGKWIEDILQNHHSAIFITKPGEGIAFNME